MSENINKLIICIRNYLPTNHVVPRQAVYGEVAQGGLGTAVQERHKLHHQVLLNTGLILYIRYMSWLIRDRLVNATNQLPDIIYKLR